MTVVLVPMTADRLARLRPPLERAYAEDLVQARGMTPEQARARSAEQIDAGLPDGVETRDVLLRVALVDGTQVGWIWVNLPGRPGQPEIAWINNIEVDPAHRGRGYARRMIQLIEDELLARGVDQLGLNVFGDNTVAIRLYESLGFEVRAQQMAKRLGG